MEPRNVGDVEIWYCDDESSETLLKKVSSYMSELTKSDVRLEGKECTAVHTVLNMEGYEPSISDMVFIPLSDTSCIRVIINVSNDGVQTGISAEDSDVPILNSIQMK